MRKVTVSCPLCFATFANGWDMVQYKAENRTFATELKVTEHNTTKTKARKDVIVFRNIWKKQLFQATAINMGMRPEVVKKDLRNGYNLKVFN